MLPGSIHCCIEKDVNDTINCYNRLKVWTFLIEKNYITTNWSTFAQRHSLHERNIILFTLLQLNDYDIQIFS